MTEPNTNPVRILLPRRESGGDRSSSQVAAASQAAPPHPRFPAAAASPGLRAGGFYSHPGDDAAIRGGGPASPSGPTALVPDCGASSLAANGNASGTPFGVSDCLSQPRRGIVPVLGQHGGGSVVSRSPYVRDITGHRNGRLVAIKCVGLDKDQRALWLCRCDCGAEKVVQSNNLVRPTGTKSCGCLRRDANAAKARPGGSWNEGKSYAINGGQRCYKTRHSWAKAVIRHYGNKCEKCGWCAARCDAHHRSAKASGGLHTIANGIVLCPNCHRVAHGGGR